MVIEVRFTTLVRTAVQSEKQTAATKIERKAQLENIKRNRIFYTYVFIAMSKRNNITYVKPQEPSFLAKLKAEIGYKEGPTVETKRQRLEEGDQDQEDYDSSEERPEREDEKPQIVVLARGDLTADEVALEQQRIAKEEAERPADLSQPIVFKQRVKQPKIQTEDETEKSDKPQKSKDKKSKKSKSSSSSSSKLSFNEDEEDAEAGEE
ncbi:uncharacterized protein KIAA1143 homolog [Drosophila hydei]|uniref:Uncharacterized protein KIAA1143 homolog n=1 Tax=Drosophila hydei TaxID=7224 RepID=A0A6J1MB65_DROHY|nr:uncharacterized protein KIAA1143 homolog [Drosophila hydei]